MPQPRTRYARAARRHPVDADLFSDYALALHASKRADLARDAFDAALTLDPRHDRAAAGGARVLAQTVGPAAAVEWLTAFCDANPVARHSWTTRAQLLAMSGDVPAAVAVLEEAARRIPAVTVELAELLARAGDVDGARRRLDAYLTTHSDDARAEALRRRLTTDQ